MRLWRNPLWGVLLSPLSAVFRAAVGLKNLLYRLELLSTSELPVPAVSVGNITVGGTGKTPVVEWIGKYASALNRPPAVLTRGYKRKANRPLLITSRNLDAADLHEAGDEPALLAEKIPGAAVVIDADRNRGGLTAVENGYDGILILDDGFQHRKTARDLDLVVIDASNPWGNGHMLPAGPLREPFSSIRRAHAVILTRVNETLNKENILLKIQNLTQVPVLQAVHTPVLWTDREGREYPPHHLEGMKAVAFCGIGNPDSFLNTIRGLDLGVECFKSYPDHHWYSQKEWEKLNLLAGECGTEALVTTEKDMVRLKNAKSGGLPLFALRIEIRFVRGREILESLIRNLLSMEKGEIHE